MVQVTKILKQTFWQILGKIVTSLSTFIILGIVTRGYGEKGTGEYSLALTYLGIFYLLSDFGFNAHLLKEGKFEWNKLLGTRIIWSLLLVFLALGLLPLWPFSSSEFSLAVILGSLTIAASAVFVTCNLIFQKNFRYDLSVLASSLGTIISLGVLVYLSSQKTQVPFLLFAHLTGWLMIAGVAVILIKKFLPKIAPLYDIQYTKRLFKDSWPIAATLTLNVIYFRADAFMIAYFKSISDVGVYNVAYQIFQTSLVLPTFIMNSYYPLLVNSLKGVKIIASGLLMMAFSGSLITIFFAPNILYLLTGGGFNGSTESLRILALGFPAYFLSALFMWILVSKGQYKQMFVIYALGLFINLLLNFIYIPQYSYIASSWITVISELLILLMQIFVLRGIISR